MKKFKATLIVGEKKPVYWNITDGEGNPRATLNVYNGSKPTLKEAEKMADLITFCLNLNEKYNIRAFEKMLSALKSSQKYIFYKEENNGNGLGEFPHPKFEIENAIKESKK